MTCIVGLVDKKTVYMASDSEVSSSGISAAIRTKKIFKQGPYIIGVAGALRLSNLLQHEIEFPTPPTKNIERFMATVFSHDLAYQIKELRKMGSVTYDLLRESTALIGVRGHLFVVEEGYQVMELRYKYAAIGTGEQAANSSMFTSEKLNWTPEQRVKTAVTAACEFAEGCRGPVTVLSLKATES